MLVDARGVSSGTLIESDICVVGAGAAGITLAREFAGSGTKLCLIESGGLTFDWKTQSLGEGESVGRAYPDPASCQVRCFGGTTNAWGGWFRALDDIDFQKRAWVQDSGWPFPPSELVPYYDKAHALCQVASADYYLRDAVAELDDRRAQIIPFDSAKLETVLHRFSPPTRFGRVYHDAIERADNVTCLLHANALRLQTTHNAATVTRLAVGCLSGARFEVGAKIFVLAAGSIENARLLLSSNDVAASGLGNQHDLVGRYFMDHPHRTRVLIPGPRRPELALYGLSFKKRGISTRIALSPGVQEKEGLLNYGANIHPVYDGETSWQALKNLARALAPSRRFDRYLRGSLPFARKRVSVGQILDVVRQLDKVAAAGFRRLFDPGRFVSSFMLESKPEQAPNRNSRITLGSERDAFGLNRVRVDWQVTALDRRTLARAEEIIDGELQRLGVGRLTPLSAAEEAGSSVGGWHQMGTTRAHLDPKQGVVDAQGKVHGMSNLFVAGASVFPTGGAASPTPTILALTLRLASHLRLLSLDRAASAQEGRRTVEAIDLGAWAERTPRARAGRLLRKRARSRVPMQEPAPPPSPMHPP
jgi:choline dehydrogenase-like flavoprotein